MRISFLAGAAVWVFTCSMAGAQALPTNAEFAAKAATGNTFEIEESRVALQRATDPRLKAFAQKMIADHQDAQKKLEAAAEKDKLKAPMELDKAHQAMLDNLKTFSGTDFDKIYIADQIAGHAETVALLSDYKADGKNKALKSWADEALPVVKMHMADINAM